jgi:hypothetical protein
VKKSMVLQGIYWAIPRSMRQWRRERPAPGKALPLTEAKAEIREAIDARRASS